MLRLAAALLCLTVALPACKKAPADEAASPSDQDTSKASEPIKEITFLRYSLTPARGWTHEVKDQPTVAVLSLTPPDGVLTCIVQILKVPAKAEAIVEPIQKRFSATQIKAASLDGQLGKYEGSRFEGVVPAEGPKAALIQLAGQAHAEIYALPEDGWLVAAMIVTFGDGNAALRNQCATQLRSLRKTN
jgi:hypothetical protein